MIDQYEFYHGAALREICKGANRPVAIEVLNRHLETNKHNFGAYAVDNKIALYIKHSTSRSKSWRFSFTEEQQDHILDLYKIYERLVVLLICHDDGIVGLTFDELKEILDHEHEEIEWIGIKRRKRELYSVSGSDGKLKYKISHEAFLKKILEE